MALSKRLQAAADMVRQGSVVADIGTDHAFLPVYLLQHGVCPFAIAADIKKGPLDAALRTVETACLSKEVSLRLGDGLSPIKPEEADDIVIAGMGGETIVSILENAPWVKDRRYRLILQPMSRAEQVHRFLYENGFHIEQERWIEEAKHGYVVLCAAFADTPPTMDPFLHWKGGFCSPEGKPYWQAAAGYLQQKATGIGEKDPKTAQQYLQLAEKLLAL